MVEGGDGNRGCLNLPFGNELVDRSKRAAAEFSGDRLPADGIFIGDALEPNGTGLARKLVIDAGVVASEGAYANDGDGDGMV
jgi:hypothetical protein